MAGVDADNVDHERLYGVQDGRHERITTTTPRIIIICVGGVGGVGGVRSGGGGEVCPVDAGERGVDALVLELGDGLRVGDVVSEGAERAHEDVDDCHPARARSQQAAVDRRPQDRAVQPRLVVLEQRVLDSGSSHQRRVSLHESDRLCHRDGTELLLPVLRTVGHQQPPPTYLDGSSMRMMMMLRRQSQESLVNDVADDGVARDDREGPIAGLCFAHHRRQAHRRGVHERHEVAGECLVPVHHVVERYGALPADPQTRRCCRRRRSSRRAVAAAACVGGRAVAAAAASAVLGSVVAGSKGRLQLVHDVDHVVVEGCEKVGNWLGPCRVRQEEEDSARVGEHARCEAGTE